jgi:hypothetical protein
MAGTRAYVASMTRDAAPGHDPGNQPAQTSRPAPVLGEQEAERRRLLLAELQAALASLGVRSVLARNHRLVLRYNQTCYDPSGLTDPALHICTPGQARAGTTDSTSYRLDAGSDYPVADPAVAAAGILRHLAAAPV